MRMKSSTIIIANHEFKFDADLLSVYLEDCIEFDAKMGYRYRIGRGRGKCLEREITFDNWKRYDHRVTKKLEIDCKKDCSTQWIIMQGQLFLKAFDAYEGNKKVNLNTLFPDLFSKPSPVMAYWVSRKIWIKVGSNANYSDSVSIHVEKGYVSEIHLYRGLTERRISKEQFYDLIRMHAQMSLFKSKVSYYIACRLNEYDVVKKLIPACLYRDDWDSITIRLLDVMRKYAIYFKRLLCRYYPFTQEMLKNYQNCLNWKELSGNVFLDWDEDLLMKHKDKWHWENILYIMGIKGLESVDILKYAEMGLIEYNDIIVFLCRRNSKYDSNYANEEFEWVLRKRKEMLREEVKKAVSQRMKIEEEMPMFIAENDKPVSDLEQIISFLERKGDILDERTFGFINERCANYMETYYLAYQLNLLFCDNLLDKGLDYAFNTPKKRKVLDDAVEMFLIEESLRIQIRKVWDSEN